MGTELPPPLPISGHLDTETLGLLADVELTSESIREFAAELLNDDASIEERWREVALLAASDHLRNCISCTALRSELSGLSSVGLASSPTDLRVDQARVDQAVGAALVAFDAEYPSVVGEPDRKSQTGLKPWWQRILRPSARNVGTGGVAGGGGALAFAKQRWVLAVGAVALAVTLFALRSSRTSQLDTVALPPNTTAVANAANDTAAADKIATEAFDTAAADTVAVDIAAAAAETAAAAAEPVEAGAPPATSVDEAAADARSAAVDQTTLQPPAPKPAPTIGSASSELADEIAVNDATLGTLSRTRAPAKKSAKEPTTVGPSPAAGSQAPASQTAAPVAPDASSSATVIAIGEVSDSDALATRFEALTAATGVAASAIDLASTISPPVSLGGTAAPAAAASAAGGPTPDMQLLACPPPINEKVVAVGVATIDGKPVGVRRVRVIEAPGRGAPDNIEVLELPSCKVLKQRPATT